MPSTTFQRAAWAIVVGLLWLGSVQAAAQDTASTFRDPAGRTERAHELTARGQRLVVAGDPGSAVWYLREALRVNPAFAAAAVTLADVYLARGEASEALAVLNDVVARAPAHAALWLRLSRVLWSLHAENDAVEALREGLRRDPTNTDLLREVAERSLQRGEWLRALSAERALRSLQLDTKTVPASTGDARPGFHDDDALRVLVGTSDRARGLRCEVTLSSVRRALCGCSEKANAQSSPDKAARN